MRLVSRSAAEAASELVERVDPAGNVLEIVTRAEMRRNRLRHRCVYVAVIDGDDQVIVHQRAHWKDVYPSWWDISFGGICGVGEDWVTAAERELWEEAGLRDTLHSSEHSPGLVTYDGEDGAVIGRVFVARTNDDPVPNDGEVAVVDRVPLAQLERWMAGRRVCLDSLQLVAPVLLNMS